MPVTVRCEDPYCQTEFELEEEKFGDRAVCPTCWHVFPIPENGPPPLGPITTTTRIRTERIAFIGLLGLLGGLILAILAALDIMPMESGRVNTKSDVLMVFGIGALVVVWLSVGVLLIAHDLSWARAFKEVVDVDREPEPFQWSKFAAEPLYMLAAILGTIVVAGVATLVGFLLRMAQ